MKQVCTAIIGTGNWGSKLLAEFSKISRVKYAANRSEERNLDIKKKFPDVITLTDYREILRDPEVDAVIIATPIDTHFILAKEALSKGKHIFLEKPMCLKYSEGKELISLSKSFGKMIFVGNIFLYHPVYKKIKSILGKNKINSLLFTWNKFGTFNEDILFNLACHDLSIILDIFNKKFNKIKVEIDGPLLSKKHFCSLTLNLGKNENAKILINRLDPSLKSKKVFIEYDGRNLLWSDNDLFLIEGENFKKIYSTDKSALEEECLDFISQISNKKNDFSNANLSLEVVKILEKIKLSK